MRLRLLAGCVSSQLDFSLHTPPLPARRDVERLRKARRMPSKQTTQGWSKEDGGWGKKELKQVTTRDAEVAILATERILERTEEVAPSILLGKTLRIGKAILSENIQEDLVHETDTLENYMAMVQRDLEELKKKVKVQFNSVAEFKDPKYKAGVDLVQQVFENTD